MPVIEDTSGPLADWERDLLARQALATLTAEQGGFKARQLRCRQVFAKAEKWLRVADDDQELREGQIDRFLAILASLKPANTDLTEQVTLAWEAAVETIRDRAISMCDENEGGEYCVGGMNDFLADCDLETWDPDDQEDEDHDPLTREEAHALNLGAKFLPATSPDEVPAIEVAGVQVSVYIDDNGSLKIAVDLDEAEEGLKFTNDEVVPMEITIQGGRVYREPAWWWAMHG